MKSEQLEKIVVDYLLEGMSQPEIASTLKEKGYKPCSLSYVEKLIKELKAKHGAKSMFHLGSIITLKRYLKS